MEAFAVPMVTAWVALKISFSLDGLLASLVGHAKMWLPVARAKALLPSNSEVGPSS